MIDRTTSKDHIQELLNKYKDICHREGVRQWAEMRETMSNLAAFELDRRVQERSMEIAVASHRFAVHVLDFREFAPLKESWCLRFNSWERAFAITRLVDMGALEYSRALTQGV